MKKYGVNTQENHEAERHRQRAKEMQEEKQRQEQVEREKKAQFRDKARSKLEGALQAKNKKGIWDRYSYHIVFGVLGLLLVFGLMGKAPAERRSAKEIEVLEDDFIAKVNSEGRGYTVGPNTFFEGWTLFDVKRILSNSFTKKKNIPRCNIEEDEIAIDKYNFLEKHPNCVEPPRSQFNCSSSFAFATTGIFSDKLCILNNDEKVFRASPQHPLSCDSATSKGCEGGFLVGAMDLGRVAGFVDEECLPYDIETANECPVEKISKCKRSKIQDYCVVEGMEVIKKHLATSGPVAAMMHVTREFLVYKDGIYDESQSEYKLEGVQAVKIVGWDSDYGVDFWIIENSWGQSWGKDGYAYVKMGVTDSFLEKVALTVNPVTAESKDAQKQQTADN